jgi:ankyrin repeat protein
MTRVVEILLEKGAGKGVTDFTGKTALDWADKEDVRELLLQEQSEGEVEAEVD